MSQHIIKECSNCGNEYNINSFFNDDICINCHEDTNIIRIFEIISGDFNDVFDKTIIKATNEQIEKYCLHEFSDLEEIEELNGVNIGYCKYYDLEIDPNTNEAYEDQELRIEYYIEAIEIENYNEEFDGKIDIDLTNEVEI